MKKYIFILLSIFLHTIVTGQITSNAVSDSIRSAMIIQARDTLLPGTDTLIQTLETFYSSGDVYVHIGQVAGGQFKAVSHSVVPNIFKFNDTSLKKAWHIYEIDNWLSGATGTNYGGYSFSGIGTITATLTISGDDFTGLALNNTDALGMAFYHFLLDPDFETYLE